MIASMVSGVPSLRRTVPTASGLALMIPVQSRIGCSLQLEGSGPAAMICQVSSSSTTARASHCELSPVKAAPFYQGMPDGAYQTQCSFSLITESPPEK
jgi:hypothetical protein